MNFTLKEYFYKLSNRCMILMLLPMAEFLAIYYLILSGVLPVIIKDELLTQLLLMVAGVIGSLILTIVHWSILQRCKKISNEHGLGKKLDLYYPLARKKTNALVGVSLFFAACFFFTGHAWFSVYFGVVILWSLIQWPSPRKVASDLKLKGDERELVLTKGESFRI